MLQSRWLHYGALLVGASGLLWLGAWLTTHILWILPFTAAFGGILIVIGIATEIRKRRLGHTGSPLVSAAEPKHQTLP